MEDKTSNLESSTKSSNKTAKSSAFELNHIVLFTSDITKTAQFYNSIGIKISEIQQLECDTPITKIIRTVLGVLPQLALKYFKSTLTSKLKGVLTQVCYLRTTENAPLFVFMAQQNYDFLEYIPVSGHTVYKTSWLLSPDVEAEALSWDLNEMGIWFSWADTGSDGQTYSQNQSHSLFLKDPDGRFVELIPNENKGEDQAMASQFVKQVSELLYPMLYSDKCDIWSTYMNSTFGLKEASVSYKYESGAQCTILSWKADDAEWPVLAVICKTDPAGNKTKYGGYGLDHLGYTGFGIGSGHNKAELADHEPRNPDKLYEHRLCMAPDGVLIEYMKLKK
jgi:hypothetical protein